MFLRIRKSTDDSWHLKMLKNFITSGYHKNLPLWVLKAIHDYFCVYFMYFSKIPNRLGICIFMTAVTEAVPCLFSHCSCSLHAIFLLCLSTHKQTNKQCFLLPPGPLPAVLMSTGKGQKQPCHKDLCWEVMLFGLLPFFRVPAKTPSAGRAPQTGTIRGIQSFS